MASSASERPRTSIGRSWAQTLALFRSRETAAMIGLGFASGLPLLLVLSTLSVWLRQAGVSRTEIGLLAWALLAYTLKPFWAPLVDRVRLPVLHRMFGQRRSWMVLAQGAITAAIVAMALGDPRNGILYLATWAVILAFASATLDIAIDAWRVESGTENAQGALASAYQVGYRFGIIASGAIALYLADLFAAGATPETDWAAVNQAWSWTYLAMAGFAVLGFAAMWYAPEPPASAPRPVRGIAGFAASVIEPFIEFFRREGPTVAFAVLAFTFISRISEFFMGPMANPMYVDVGYSASDIATASKVIGAWTAVVGAVAGGVAVARFGIPATLAIGVALITLPNVVFAWVALSPAELWRLVAAVGLDNFCNGFGGTIFIAYLTAYANRAHAATQYAFLAAWSQLPGRLLAGTSGATVDSLARTMGDAQAYAAFFVGTSLIAIPGLILGVWCARLLAQRDKRRVAGEASAAATAAP